LKARLASLDLKGPLKALTAALTSRSAIARVLRSILYHNNGSITLLRGHSRLALAVVLVSRASGQGALACPLRVIRAEGGQ
jgi:hypothetical protein